MKRLMSWKSLVFFCSLPLASAALAGDTTTYTYDSLGRLVAMSVSGGPNTNVTAGYSYDAAGNRTQANVSLPSSQVVIQVTSSANLRTLANAAGYTGASGVSYQFVVPSGTTIMGAASGGTQTVRPGGGTVLLAGNGGIGIDTGVWPAGATLSLVVNGAVYGGGGQGGSGMGGYGGAGGAAVNCQAPITLTVSASGTIKGGGGGGGVGSASFSGSVLHSGSGGGGGFPNGPGGSDLRTVTGIYIYGGSPGTVAGGGVGGPGTYPYYSPAGSSSAGNGGDAGSAGQASGASGGASGYAVRLNGNAVTVSNAGTIVGTQG